MLKYQQITIFAAIISLSLLFLPANAAIQDEIAERQKQIEEIQRQIEQYQTQIEGTRTKSRTLENEISKLNGRSGKKSGIDSTATA